MKKFIYQLAINAFAFFVAITLLRGNGIRPLGNTVVDYLALALIFAVINALLRPFLTVLGCPFIILTLGLGVLLINTLLFVLTGWIGTQFDFGFTVSGFWPALLGALIVSLIGVFFNVLLRNELKD